MTKIRNNKMEHMEEDMPADSQLSFIAKVLSVFTHEIKNHLAIIKESNGLIGDLITLGQTAPNAAQCLKIIESVEHQITKTSLLCTNLNRLGHRMDMSVSTFNLNECLEELLSLIQRTANQKKLSFKKDFAQNIPSLYNSPSKLQFLIFCLLEKSMDLLDYGGKIIIKTAYTNGSVSISIIPKGDFKETNADSVCYDKSVLHMIINKMGGDISCQTGDETTVITLPVFLNSGQQDE
ncbi:MAG: HAMP domain-containing histidine kinase [Nitrospirae bacterium]|nr:HAMP domain-containing histidine kinase [Nitrospirota bacterium]